MARLNLQLFAVKLNTNTSIVDYLKSQGKDSSYSARKKLASDLGISDYKGTAKQNTQMLKTLKNGSSGSNTSKNATNKPTSNSTGASSNNKVTPISGVDQSLVDTINSNYTASDKTTGAQKEAGDALTNVKELGSVKDIISKDTWNAINTPFSASSAYQEAMAYTNQLLAQMSSGRTSYTDQIKDMMGQIQNREKFQYDVSTDTMFQQALSSAMNSGRTAMQDTIGQASALTGGYGSTYATSAGNQTYNAYIQDAYNNLPEYYQMAMEAYQMEGQEMYNQLAMLSDADASEYQRMYDSWNANFSSTQQMYAQEYGAWQDSVNNAYNSANLQMQEHGQMYDQAYNTYTALQNNANTLYAQEYQKWADEVANAMNYAGMQNTDYWNNQNFLEEQRQYNTSLDWNKEQFRKEMEYKNSALTQDQNQFISRYDINGDGKVDAKDQVVTDGDSGDLKTLTNRELNTVKEVYRNAGGGEKGETEVDKYLASIGKENVDYTELDNELTKLDSEMSLPWHQDWNITTDSYNGGFLGLPIFQGEDHDDYFSNGEQELSYDQLKELVNESDLSDAEKKAFLKKLQSQSKN